MNFVGPEIRVPLPAPAIASRVAWTHLALAVQDAGEVLQAEWTRLAAGELVNRMTGAYVNGLRQSDSLQYPLQGDALSVGVFNLARHAAAIEYGFAAFNLAERINWGATAKSRLSKEGRWYIRVPFRHYTPPRTGEGATVSRTKRSMPAELHDVVRGMKAGERLTFDMGRLRGNIREMSRNGRVVAARGDGAAGGRYVTPLSSGSRRAAHASATTVDLGNGRSTTVYPGRHKSPESIAASLEGGQPTDPRRSSASIYEGMFRSGAGAHAQYTTIRTITQDSTWWIPGRPGLYVARQVLENQGPEIKNRLQEAAARDIERAIALGLAGAA